MSCDIAKINQVWRFEIGGDNTGEMNIVDELLDTEERAKQRAKSEFLKNAYSVRDITFSTYRTDLSINDTISVGGLPYLVKAINYDVGSTKIVIRITARRYE